MITLYNKLVRDRIPEIIQGDAKSCTVRTLDPAAYRQALLEKLVEEAQEVRQTEGDREELVKELADVYEVIDALVKEFDLSREEIESVQKEKREQRGGFEKKLFLESAGS